MYEQRSVAASIHHILPDACFFSILLEQCARLRPSITIMDGALPDGNGIEVCRTIKRTSPHISVLILSAVDDNATVFGAISAGASGYV
ncbi:MAG TPA: response regulator transcription factor, partial [bacterium]|nr:response regulator transcription factor [bacterium]